MMKINKLIALAALLTTFAMILNGCQAPNSSALSSAASALPSSTSNSASQTEALPQIDAIEMVTGAATGSWVPVGAAMASEFNNCYDGFPLTAVPGPGSVGNIPVVASGDAAFGLSYGPFLVSALKGESPYEQPLTNLRAIAALQPTVIHILIDADPSIKSINDVITLEAAIKMGVPPTGQASNFLVNNIFEAAGLGSVEALKTFGGDVYMADGASLTDAWKDRQINAIFLTYNVPASNVSEALTSRSGRLLAVDGNIAKTLVDTYGFAPYTIPANTYKGQDADVNSVALPIVVFTADDTPDDLVYNMTKAIYEGKSQFVNSHKSFEEFDPEIMEQGTGIALHPGAEKFYKEVGLLK